MEHNVYSFKSNDGLNLFAQSWTPGDTIKGKILLIHGIGEHSERYSHVGARFAEAGFALTAFDLRGHGRSDGKRGYIPSFDAFLDDIDNFIAINSYDDNSPLFLYGHSLGGLLVLYYSMRRKTKLNGLIASTPSLRNEIENQKIKLLVVSLLGGILPSLTLPSGLDVNYLSRDADVVNDYINDPLVHNRVSLSFAVSSLKAISYVLANPDKIELPLLVMHGSMDKISFPSGSDELVSKIHGNVIYKKWEGCFHELHNEPNREELFAFTIDWLNSQI